MRGVNDAIQDGIGDPAAAQVLMPVGHGQLRCDGQGAGAVALFDGLEEVLFLRIGETAKGKIVNDQQVYFGQALEEAIIGTLRRACTKRVRSAGIRRYCTLNPERQALRPKA